MSSPGLSIVFQFLTTRVEIEAEDGSLAGRLRYLVNGATQDVPIVRTLRYRIMGRGPWSLFEFRDLVDVLDQVDDLVAALYLRIHGRMCERYSLGGWSVFHGVLATVGGSRFMLIGHPEVGKTTLATTLVFAGHSVEGDEMIFVRDGLAVALPRRFHLKAGTERLVPELAPLVADLPLASTQGPAIRGFDPTEAGLDWSIRCAPIDCVVVLDRPPGGKSELSALGSFEVVQALLEHALHWVQSRSILVAAASTLGRSGGLALTLGTPAEAVALLESWRPGQALAE